MQQQSSVHVMALMLLLGLLVSMVVAWIWVILRLAEGRSVLPPGTPRVVPWGPGSVLIAMLVGVVLAPAAEELIFRGVLLGWLTKIALGVKKPEVAHPLFDASVHDIPIEPISLDVFDPETIPSSEFDPGSNPYSAPTTPTGPP